MKQDKTKFTETLKLFDNKDYKNCKKACIKILDKDSKNANILALKGITLYHLGSKEEGMADLKAAVKLQLKNPICWHFLALYYKEEKDYNNAMKNYTMALKNDPSNFNILREQSYLQLYLRLYDAFFESTKSAISLRSSLSVNWVTYSFAAYLINEYNFANKIVDLAFKNFGENLKKNELYELKNYKVKILLKIGNDASVKEALDYINANEKDFIDKTCLNEYLYNIKTQLKMYEESLININKLIEINSDNINYFISKIKALILINNKDSNNINNNLNNEINEEFVRKVVDFKTLLIFIVSNNNEEFNKILSNYLLIINKDYSNDNYLLNKSKVYQRLNLALANNNEFESLFNNYLKTCIFSTNPSIFVAIKWIYNYKSTSRLSIINKILGSIISELNEHNTVFGSNLIPHIAWFNYYISLHNTAMCNFKEALNYINKAIDSTPSVIDFYTHKSFILKKTYQFKDSSISFKKAKLLDVGDRFLNAKYAKTVLRAYDLKDSLSVMNEFVKNPLDDENIDHIQTNWYILEVASYYLRNNKIPQADRLLRSILTIFNSIFEDQFDFYNFCLRRNVVTQLIESIEYLDKVYDHDWINKALELIDYVYEYYNYLTIKGNENLLKKEENQYLEIDKINDNDFKDTKFKYTSVLKLKESLLKDILYVLNKVQSYTKNSLIHNMIVKYSLLEKKPLIALKSLNYLKNNTNNNLYYYASLDLYVNYIENAKVDSNNNFNLVKDIIEENNEDLKDTKKSKEIILKEANNNFINIYYNLYNSSENNNAINFINVNNKLQLSLDGCFFSLIKNKYSDSKLKDLLEYILNNQEYKEVKFIRFEIYNKLIILSMLFISKEYSDKWKDLFIKKFDEFSKPSVSIYNLDMFDIFNEDKKPKLT